MRLITYKTGETEQIGLLHQNGQSVLPVSECGLVYQTMTDLIKNVSTDEITLMAPIPVPEQDIIYLGINYSDHGKLRQNSNTEMLIHDIDEVIHDLSAGMTLKAGTIISMGTPGGVGMGFQPPKFLKQGDEVTCEVEAIGELTNKISNI